MASNQRLSGKSAVVTGAGSAGIGKAIAFGLAAEGAQVVVNDIGTNPEGARLADLAVKQIKDAGGKAVANYDSVATIEGGENIVKTAISNFGKIDILVNCAGVFKSMATQNMTEKDWDSVINTHLKGHFACSKAAMVEMMRQKSGRIINFSSRGAFHGPPVIAVNPNFSCLAYNTAKAGVLGFTTALASELSDQGITVNAILPSAITTLFPFEKKPLTDNIPVPANTQPEYVVPIVVYLASDAAAKITGRYFYSCGGDICLYGRPLQLPGPHMFMHKNDKWTFEELDQIIPQMLK
jgi:NAD(P)-dependent dehydrogenase (short-subunit alcohol dehydrogenase family)